MGLSLRRQSGKYHGKKLNYAVVEAMEQRMMLSVFTVTNTGDNGGVNPSAGAGTGTLRQAIIDSNADTGQTNTIDFNIAPSGVQTIEPVSALPNITQSVIVDGTSEPGYAVGAPVIVLDSQNTASDGLEFMFSAGHSTVEGLDITQSFSDGIGLLGASDVTVVGNFIGTDVTGTVAQGNANGILIVDGATGDIIGGTTAAARNVISGNVNDGVAIDGMPSGPQTTQNLVEGNYIGTDASGANLLGNGGDGVVIETGATDNTVGGITAGAGNIISGNDDILGAEGVEIDGTASGPQTSDNIVEGNDIGTDVTGMKYLANANGIQIEAGANGNVIGGTTAAARNIISGNNGIGVEITGSASGPQTTQNLVEGNYIGTNVAGTASLENPYGVEIDGGASDNTIGGASAAARNVISGNNTSIPSEVAAGVVIEGTNSGPQTTENLVEGNFIGTDATGTTALANATGIQIVGGATDNSIGGSVPADGNLIAYNTGDGIIVGAHASDSTTVLDDIRLNSIYGNGGLGIDLGNTGVTTPNSSGGPHTGPNDFQNFPVLASAVSSGSTTTVLGGLNSTANSSFLIDFYSNPTLDADGSLQGQTYLGTEYVTTDANGNAAINTTLTTAVATSDYVTATATSTVASPYGDTSEFAAPVQVTGTGGSSGNSNTDVLTGDGDTFAATEGDAFSGDVASFTDTNLGATISTFTATINWGDGSATAPGTIQSNGTGGFNVVGTHTYAVFGTYDTSITITPMNGSAVSPTGVANVADAALMALTAPINLGSSEGKPTGNVIVGYFKDADPNANVSEYEGVLNWGDGTATIALTSADLSIVSQNSAGTEFAVTGNHTYADFGTYHVSIGITDDGGNPANTGGSTALISQANIKVADLPLTAGTTALSYNATEGNATSRVIIGYFTDADLTAKNTDYIGSINWGDGSAATTLTSANIVAVSTSSAGVKFAVYGSHTFLTPGTYHVMVNITDDDGISSHTGGSTATIKETTFAVADAPLTGYSVTGLTAMENKTFTGVVATFLDHDPLAVTDDYTVMINWGDGTTTSVIPTYGSTTHLWSVTGSHKYTKTGTFSIVMTAKDGGGSSTTATSKIKVNA